jgi:hypothetical protein
VKHVLLRFCLVLGLSGCLSQAAPRTIVATGERDAQLNKSEGAIRGQVRDAADGMPLSMVSISAELDGTIVAHDVSDHEGNYRLGPLAPEHYRVSAHFADARVVYEGVVVHEQVQTDVNIGIDLRPQGDRSTTVFDAGELGTIEGVVLEGVDGNQFPGTVLSLSASHLDDALMSIADASGRFRFGSLRPGIYSLSCFYHLVEQGNVEIRRGNIIVTPGEITNVQMHIDLKMRKL